MTNDRPNPDALLQEVRAGSSGKLKIYFGYAAGVGKTFAMLNDAHEELERGIDVVAGYIEPHNRKETMRLLDGLPKIQTKLVTYKNMRLEEFDVDAVLLRQPGVVLVDELAHTNAPGSRNKKRYQDVRELLDAGIDVYTTVNVQHIESLNDIVEDITQIAVKETIPDQFFDQADFIKLIDVEPDELLKRFSEGKIYEAERAALAMHKFFTKENLKLLREIAMRKVTDRISFLNEQTMPFSDKRASMKLLVCINESGASQKLIRWTARAAEAFHASFTALYVDDGDTESLPLADKKTLQENLALAEKLGADTVTINGHNLSETIAEYAKLSGVTNIVLGKSKRKSFLLGKFGADLEDELIDSLQAIEIHIIPSSRKEKTKTHAWTLKNIVTWHDTAKMFAALILATILSAGLSELGIGDQNIIMVYILSVLVISRITTGYLYGIIGSLLAVLIFNFFFMTPLYTFNTVQVGYPVTYGIMLLVALITSALTVRMKKIAKQAVVRERRTEILYELNKKLLVTRQLDGILELVTAYLVRLLGRSIIVYAEEPKEDGTGGTFLQENEETGALAMLSLAERAVVHWVFRSGKEAGRTTDTLSGSAGFYLPVISGGKILGVIGIFCDPNKEALTQDNRLFLRMVSSQVATSLERQKLTDEQRQILIETEKEQMRSNLLRAISHDLRTPLTGILGASSALLENQLDETTRNKLVLDIKEDSEWLIRMVENLLSVTRINEGMLTINADLEAAEEVIGGAVRRIRSRFKNRTIHVRVPDEVVLIPMDGTLIEQVLINLMENALRHGGADAKVWVNAAFVRDEVVFTVKDDGVGIPKERFGQLFDNFGVEARERVDMTRGLGIGLSICMSIIKAHGGKMEVAENPGGGALFGFTLPLGGDSRAK